MQQFLSTYKSKVEEQIRSLKQQIETQEQLLET